MGLAAYQPMRGSDGGSRWVMLRAGLDTGSLLARFLSAVRVNGRPAESVPSQCVSIHAAAAPAQYANP